MRHTSVKLAPQRGCKSSCHVRLSIHGGLNQISVLNDKRDLGISISLRTVSQSTNDTSYGGNGANLLAPVVEIGRAHLWKRIRMRL